MMRIAWLVILGLTLYGCGSDSEDMSSMEPDDDADWMEDAEESIETGTFSANLPGEHGSGRATCSVNLTRAVDKSLANIILTLDVIAEGCNGMGNCSNPDSRGGVVNFSGGIDGDQPFGTMLLNYEPPGDSDDEAMWMYNVLFKTAPFSRFEMRVDGEDFNVLTSDLNGADDFATGPHLWATAINIEADMLQSSSDDNPSTPGLQTRGELSYEGPCEAFGQYLQL